MNIDYIIVGLGNPGRKYKKTYHNLGFLALDIFRKQKNFPSFTFSKLFNADISKGILNEKNILLVKPQTFMNLSGQSVSKIINYYKIDPQKLLIIHDDIDIPQGDIKVSEGRGSAGHKGIESIIENIGTKSFTRVRIGILPKNGKLENTEKFVLKKIKKEDLNYSLEAFILTINQILNL